MNKKNKSNFSKLLLTWFEDNKRNLPWKDTKDPYKIWLSEIILQQTRVAQGLPYYLKFIEAFPTIFDLAKAKEDKVLKLWEGLGYYSRARNLHYTAKEIVTKYKGIFPDEYKDISSLKGIGPYTTAAILSFAFEKIYPVVDGNVFRIVSRYLGSFEAIDVQKNHYLYYKFLNEVIDQGKPGEFNQAMMDLGASICTPQNYKCTACPLQENCHANKNDLQAILPIKVKQLVKRDRFFNYLIFTVNNEESLIEKRKIDIWKGLFQFPLIEGKGQKKLSAKELRNWISDLGIECKELKINEIKTVDRHILTHQNIYATFYRINIDKETFKEMNQYFILFTKKNKSKFAFPKVIVNYLEN